MLVQHWELLTALLCWDTPANHTCCWAASFIHQPLSNTCTFLSLCLSHTSTQTFKIIMKHTLTQTPQTEWPLTPVWGRRLLTVSICIKRYCQVHYILLTSIPQYRYLYLFVEIQVSDVCLNSTFFNNTVTPRCFFLGSWVVQQHIVCPDFVNLNPGNVIAIRGWKS